MLPIAWYLLKVMICSGILFGYYWLLLRNKIFHQYNRFYLLAAVVLSLTLPIIQINFWQADAQQSPVVRVLQAVSSGDEYVNNVITSTKHRQWDLQQLYPFIYLVISSVFLALFFRTLFAIRTLLKKYPAQVIDKVTLIKTDDKSTPFSFLNFIFWNNSIDPETTTGKQIFKHEVAHVQEKHTHDKLFINIVLVFGWSNPFFWLIRKELNMIHEFIADKKAIEDSDTAAFAAMILHATYPRHHFKLANHFFYSPIKRRLLMLTKNKNPKVNYLARIMVLPLALLVFAAFTLKAKSNLPSYHGKKITVVIDAGHGGTDAGAKSPDGKFSEKDLTLDIIKKIKELNTNDRINIILTREDDTYQSPPEKVNFAKSQNADLFISFHLDNGPATSANTESGMTVWVSNDEYPNSSKSKILASAIINTFSNNYGLDVMQQSNQRKKSVWVLQSNTCPAVLIEAGFINNEKDLAYLQTNKAKETIARNILSAIEKFAAAAQLNNYSNPAVPIADTVPLKNINLSTANGKQPVYFLNGVEVDSSIIHRLNPNNIDRINVLKDKYAIQKYGAKAINGVVDIYTKSKDITGINNNLSTNPGSDNDVSIHANSISIKNAPANVLYILNGKETDKATVDNIKPTDIEDVRIFKDDVALKVYGEKGKHGVIIINTKLEYIATSRNWEASKLTIDNKAIMTPDSRPVIIIDNKEYPGKTLDEIVAITGTNQFETIRIISPEEAIKQYGQMAKDGAVLVITKKTAQNKLPTTDQWQIAAKQNYPDTLERNKVQSIVFSKTETESKFPGNEEDWKKFLIKNLDPGVPVNEGWKPGVYKVMLQFVVSKDGTISDVKALNYQGSKTAEHCINLIKKGPKWIPAIQNGKPVNAYRRQPITFMIEESK